MLRQSSLHMNKVWELTDARGEVRLSTIIPAKGRQAVQCSMVHLSTLFHQTAAGVSIQRPLAKLEQVFKSFAWNTVHWVVKAMPQPLQHCTGLMVIVGRIITTEMTLGCFISPGRKTDKTSTDWKRKCFRQFQLLEIQNQYNWLSGHPVKAYTGYLLKKAGLVTEESANTQ